MPTNPTNTILKNIFFEARFPNLFYIENKIGDFQLKILDKFPRSSLLLRQRIIFADLGTEAKPKIPENTEKDFGKKIWNFKSDTSEIELCINSIIIKTGSIKTYQNEEGFRSLIEFVLSNFLEIVAIPEFTWLGLRYVNEYNISHKTNEEYNNFFKTTFPLRRFKLEDSDEMYYRTTSKVDRVKISFQEIVQTIGSSTKLILDLDAFKKNINTSSYLAEVDTLHQVIKSQFYRSVKEPFLALMSQRP